MKTFIFFITIAIICSIQEFVNAFNIWSHFIENNKEEKNIIENGKGILIKYEHKNECFKEASISVKNDCSKLENVSKDEKMKYAIRLTLCQLEYTKLTIPEACKNESEANIRICIDALSIVPQFWTSYVQSFADMDLLSQSSANITKQYDNILGNINNLISSLRDEEKERLPRITNSLNELVNGIETLKYKSSMTMKEIEIFEKMFRTFQKEIKNALSQIIKTFNDEVGQVKPYVESIFKAMNKNKEKYINAINTNLGLSEKLSISHKVSLNQLNEMLHKIAVNAKITLDEHQQLKESVENTKYEISELLTFSKNEIKGATNDIKKVADSINVITGIYIIIYKFVIFLKKWFFIVPVMASIVFGYNSAYILGEMISLLLMIYDNQLSFYGFDVNVHFISMIIGSLISKYAVLMINRINKYIIFVFVIFKVVLMIYINTYRASTINTDIEV